LSAVALSLDYVVYLFSIYIGAGAPVSSVIGYACGLILAYLLMNSRVFDRGWLEDKKHLEFFGFLISGLWGVFLTFSTVYITNILKPGDIHIAKISAICVSFFGVYLFRKHFVFRRIEILP
jgi:putative flippase GtrA